MTMHYSILQVYLKLYTANARGAEKMNSSVLDWAGRSTKKTPHKLIIFVIFSLYKIPTYGPRYF